MNGPYELLEVSVLLRDFVYQTHHTKDADTDRRGLFTLSKTSVVSLQALVASLQAPVDIVHPETYIPAATPPLQPAISLTPATTSRKIQSVATTKEKSRSIAPSGSNSCSPTNIFLLGYKGTNLFNCVGIP